MWGDQAAADLGLTAEQWWEAVEWCPRFRFDAPGRAGWTVVSEEHQERKRRWATFGKKH